VTKLDVTDATIRKCKNVSIFIDKKMRERRIEHEKYIIMLADNIPFKGDDQVKIIRKGDFDKLGDMIKSLRNERNLLQNQVTELQSVLDVQKVLIDKIDYKKVETKKEDKKSLRELIGL